MESIPLFLSQSFEHPLLSSIRIYERLQSPFWIEDRQFLSWLQGAAATQYLSDLAADVVKIEPITGAHERHWSGGRGFVNGVSTFFLSANRNKRSLAVNLKEADGLKTVLKLIASADAVVENFRPGVMDRLGWDLARSGKSSPT
jgi:crotonobetainyl-CoA:carnitine CoA-transferase CaiB-like acyl-CoA transferase